MIPNTADFTAARILWHGHAQAIRWNAPLEICANLLAAFESIEFHGADPSGIYIKHHAAEGSGAEAKSAPVSDETADIISEELE